MQYHTCDPSATYRVMDGERSDDVQSSELTACDDGLKQLTLDVVETLGGLCHVEGGGEGFKVLKHESEEGRGRRVVRCVCISA